MNLGQENQSMKGGYPLELHTQIKKCRTDMNLSQEELAEKVYVTRQTISNWENNKSYPDIHSLLLLSSAFNISLDQLIKGDVKIMKEEINKSEIKKFNRDGAIFTILLILSIVSVVPLTVFLSFYGLIIAGVIWGISMFFALRIEKFKKSNNIQTYKEIVSFTEGKRLDEIEKAQESGKRPYQKLLLALLSGLITFIVCMFFVWLLKSYIF
jgi:transcriptional regulator with XRE-family HTH domain